MNQEEGRGQLSRILNARILVVDDKEANVRLIEGMLRVAGHPECMVRRLVASEKEKDRVGLRKCIRPLVECKDSWPGWNALRSLPI